MRTIRNSICVIATSLLLTGIAHATAIVQDTANGALQLQAYETVGQSFTALDDQLGSFGFYLKEFNPQYTLVPVTVTIFDGAGFGGMILGSQVISANAGFNGWVDASFAIATTANHVYTASITTANPYWGAELMWSGNPYAGGDAYYSGNMQAGADLRFRVNAVPEPETYAMLLAGLGIVGAIARRRKRD